MSFMKSLRDNLRGKAIKKQTTLKILLTPLTSINIKSSIQIPLPGSGETGD